MYCDAMKQMPRHAVSTCGVLCRVPAVGMAMLN